MIKKDVIKKINEHLIAHNKIMGFNSNKNKEYIDWINDYYKNSEIKDSSSLEKMWVLTHDDKIEHCEICGKKSVFGNFNAGYRSKRCKTCGSPEGYRKLAEKRKKESPVITVIKKCKECNKEFSYESRKLNNTINKYFCSKSCASMYNQKHMSDEIKKQRFIKTNRTNLEKYGDPWVVNSKYSRKKTKEKLGVEYSLQLKSIQEKTKESCFKNTGYTNPLKNPKILKKMMQTKIKRYGDLLIPMSKYKEYIMPSGKIIRVQGNEAYALNLLIKKFNESDIFVGRKNIENEIGKITYLDKNNHLHIYYPDIYIKSENKIYEVKSQFTYNIHKEVNELKKQAVLNKNIKFEFLIIN